MKENNGHISLKPDDDKAYLPLYDFFIALKRNNFLVTPLQIADANRIIDQYADNVQSETELCNYLAPVFANSEEEQIQFRLLFEEFFTPQLRLALEKNTDLLKDIEKEGEKEEEPKKKHWVKILLWIFLAIAILVAGYFLFWPGPKEIIKPQFHLDSKLSFADSTKKNKRLDVTVYPDSVTDKTSYKVNFNWGDGSAVDTTAYHIYSKDSIYEMAAYVAIYYKGSLKFTDTLNHTVAICFSPATIEIEKSFSGDSIATGKEFSLKAIINGKKPDSIVWSNDASQDNIETNKTALLKTTVYTEAYVTYNCQAYYGGNNSACNQQAEISFMVYDTTPKPRVIFRPAKNAQPVTLQNKVYGYWFYILGSLVILSLFFAGFFALRRSRLKKQKSNSKEEALHQYDEMINSFSGKTGSEDIPFHNKNFLPLPEPELSDIARLMRKRINDDASYMHVGKTISKAILNAGFFEPVTALRTQQSEFLVLINQTNANDQQVKLFEFLLDLLKKQNVLIDKYYYKVSPLQCYHENETNEISLEKLSEKYPEHILLIFGDAYQLIYPDYPVIVQEYMALLNRWPYKAIMTPVSFNDWGNKEKKILLQQLPVFPVDIPGQLLLMQRLFVEELNILSVLNQYSDEFYEAGMVDFEDMDELLDYCAEADWAIVKGGGKYSNLLFQWIAALAVYPKISWELTLSVGKAILDKSAIPQELNFTNLLRLARVSWMKLGKFPDYTRLNLLKELSPENEITARETILQAINEIPETELNAGHFAFEEKESQRLINEFNLYAYDPVKYAGYIHSKELFAKLNKDELITDVTAKTYLENPGLNWKTLINDPDKNAGAVQKPENISLQNYLDETPEKNSLQAKIYLWATALSALLFIASLLGLIFLAILTISGSYRFAPFTHRQAVLKKIQINHYNSSVDTTTQNLTITIDKVSADFTDVNDYTIDSTGKPLQLQVLVNDSAKEVIVNWNQFPLFDSTMVILYDAYDLELTNDNVPTTITANVLLVTGCKAGMSIYKGIILAVDSNISVKQIDVDSDPLYEKARAKADNNTDRCLNRIAFGSAVDKSKIDSIIAGFLDYGMPLKVDRQSMYAVGPNEIIIYNSRDTINTPQPVIYLLISDSSLMASAKKFKKELEGNGLKVKPVALSSFNYNSDIYYYRNAQQFNANKINNLYNKYYPTLRVKAHLAIFPPGQALADTNAIVVWIKMLEPAKPLTGLTATGIHYQSPDKKITGDFYINPKTNKWEELNNDKLNYGQIKPMKLTSRSEYGINFNSNINIDLKAGIINVDGNKFYNILSITDGKNTKTFPVKPDAQNGALEFDGKSGYVQMGDFNLGTSDFTLEAWIKPVDFKNQCTIITNRSDEYDNDGNWFKLVLAESSYLIGAQFAKDKFKNYASTRSKTPLLINTWNHIALTRKSNIITIYINGNKSNSFFDEGVRNLTTGKKIGRLGGWPETKSSYYNGLMDEVRIWKVARTQSQIRATMQQEIPANSPGLSSYYKFNETSGGVIKDETGRNNGNIKGKLSRVKSSILGFMPFKAVIPRGE